MYFSCYVGSRGSSVGIALGYELDDWGSIPGRGVGIFLFTTASRTALGPTQPPIQWVQGALSSGVKQQAREADHSPPSSAEVREWVELHLHSPNTHSWRGAQLKHRGNFTHAWERSERHKKFWSKGRIILKLISGNRWEVLTAFISVPGFCEHDNEPSDP
jgi:hypothetical protein